MDPKELLSMYRYTKNTYHFIDALNTQFQFNINFEERSCRLWMRKVGEKEWVEVKTKFIPEMSHKFLQHTKTQKDDIEKLITGVMIQVNMERLMGDEE